MIQDVPGTVTPETTDFSSPYNWGALVIDTYMVTLIH